LRGCEADGLSVVDNRVVSLAIDKSSNAGRSIAGIKDGLPVGEVMAIRKEDGFVDQRIGKLDSSDEAMAVSSAG
jgi:hypothetical protein